MKLEDITSVLSNAVVQAQKQAEEQAHERFTALFEDPDKDGVYTPRFVWIKIGSEKIKAAVFTLMKLTAIRTKKMKFKLDTDLDLSGHEDKDGNPDIKVSLKSGLFGRTSHIKISAEFEGVDPPEALLQMQDEMNNRIAKALAKLEQEESESESEPDN